MVLKFVLLVEIAVAFTFPEAASAHVKACLSLLQHNQCAHKLEVRSHLFLHLLDYFFRGAIGPLLGLFCIIGNVFKLLVYECVDFVFHCLLDEAKGDFFICPVCSIPHVSSALVS